MKPDIKKYLHDMITSVNAIYSFIGEKRDFNEYSTNKMLRRAVEREFEIIGEAMNRAIKIDSQINITSKELIIGLQNRIIHGYDRIDDVILWGAIVRHLPVLKTDIEALLKK